MTRHDQVEASLSLPPFYALVSRPGLPTSVRVWGRSFRRTRPRPYLSRPRPLLENSTRGQGSLLALVVTGTDCVLVSPAHALPLPAQARYHAYASEKMLRQEAMNIYSHICDCEASSVQLEPVGHEKNTAFALSLAFPPDGPAGRRNDRELCPTLRHAAWRWL
jgi:hypothetical protein